MAFPVKGIFYEMNSLFTCQGTFMDGRKLPCADFELNAAECLEAYGIVRGTGKCAKFMEDLKECRYLWNTKMRYVIMKHERMKQIVTGEKPISERKGAPYPHESFVIGSFNP